MTQDSGPELRGLASFDLEAVSGVTQSAFRIEPRLV